MAMRARVVKNEVGRDLSPPVSVFCSNCLTETTDKFVEAAVEDKDVTVVHSRIHTLRIVPDHDHDSQGWGRWPQAVRIGWKFKRAARLHRTSHRLQASSELQQTARCALLTTGGNLGQRDLEASRPLRMPVRGDARSI